jgi:hypothetical protein
VSALERWAARLVYLAVAPFAVFVGLLVDLDRFLIRVAHAVSAALGHGDPELAALLAVRGSFVVVSCGLIRAFLGDS